MNEEPRNTLEDGLKAASEAASLIAGLILLYRLLNPEGPEPLELLRGAWRAGLARLEAQRSYRRAMLDTLEGIRGLPETEGET